MFNASHKLDDSLDSSDRRNSQRHRLVLRVAKLINADGEMPCLLKNVSHTGCQVRTYAPLPNSNEFDLVLGNGVSHRCEKRWQKNKHAGFRFFEHVDLEPFLHSDFGGMPKRALRVNTRYPVLIERQGPSCSGLIENISQTGLCVETVANFYPSEEVLIRFPTKAVFTARHIWSREHHHGFNFAGVVPIETFAELCGVTRRELRLVNQN